MESSRPLAPCLIGRGTLSSFRDMLRALETLETIDYAFHVHGQVVDEGQASLVKLMADQESSTIVVNGCLFLNVASFRYLDFERADDDRWRFVLYGDDARLDLLAAPEPQESETPHAARRPRLLSEDEMPGFESLILLDEDEDDE